MQYKMSESKNKNKKQKKETENQIRFFLFKLIRGVSHIDVR